MNKTITFLGILSFCIAQAQQTDGRVGINTENPAATLDIVGKPTDSQSLDGLIAPRLTGDELFAKTYTAQQTGALVYATLGTPIIIG